MPLVYLAKVQWRYSQHRNEWKKAWKNKEIFLTSCCICHNFSNSLSPGSAPNDGAISQFTEENQGLQKEFLTSYLIDLVAQHCREQRPVVFNWCGIWSWSPKAFVVHIGSPLQIWLSHAAEPFGKGRQRDKWDSSAKERSKFSPSPASSQSPPSSIIFNFLVQFSLA